MSFSALASFFSRFALSRRAAIVLSIAAVSSCIATYMMVTERSTETDTIYWLLNLDLVLLLVMGTLISYQVVKLWLERRKGQAGAKLHVRLVLIFGCLAAAPAILMAIFSSLFLYFGVHAWFNDRVSTAVYESLEVAQAYLKEHKQVMRADVLAMANDINRESVALRANKKAFNDYIQTQSHLRNLPEAIIFTSSGRVEAKSDMSFILDMDNIPQGVFDEAQKGEVALITSGESDRIRALMRLDRFLDAYLYVGRLVDSNVLEHINTTEKAVKEYTDLESKKSQLQISITAMFVAVALILLLAAIWFGLVFAEQLVAPISALITAAEKARAGDWGTQVEESGKDDEISLLGKAFNRMTTQIKEQRDKLISVNMILDERRRFTEAVLSGASSGVLGIDVEGVITLANAKAEELLKSEEDEEIVGKELEDFIPEVDDLIAKTHEHPEKPASMQLDFSKDDAPIKTVMIRITAEQGGDGSVVTIDDISDLVSAQRQAAWADVARRIAHEIKNPLTPIQLSAERLKKKYLPQIKDDPETFEQCTDAIVRQVGDIGHMITEFSAYARMPVAIKREGDLAEVCKDTFLFQKGAHPEIEFEFEAPEEEITVNFDRSQITQVVNNLIQNSIESIGESQKESADKGSIKLSVEDKQKSVVITLEDNGAGLLEDNRAKIMEPYITSKKKGSGLGLAIVKKIIEEHDGSVVLDNSVINDTVVGVKATIILPKEV